MNLSFEQLLTDAARAFGIELEFWDIWGHHHRTPNSTLQALLAAIGLDSSNEEALIRSQAEWQSAEWSQLVPPVIVTEAAHAEMRLRMPEQTAAESSLRITIRLEDGRTEALVPAHPYAVVDTEQWGGIRHLEIRVPLPANLPYGYHQAEITLAQPAGGSKPRSAITRLIVTPSRAWQSEALAHAGRSAGVAIALYGVRSARNWGAGDFSDLRVLLDWAARGLGCAFVALNPLHAIANRQPYNTSPYLPASSFYRNFLYLDIEAIEDFALCEPARRLFAASQIQTEIASLRASETVEYERVARLKLRFLKLLYRRFRRCELLESTARGRAFRAWCAEEGSLLEQWAVYSALDEVRHKQDPSVWIWPDWPEELRDPRSPAVATFVNEHQRLVEFYGWVQWQIHLQLESAQAFARSLGMPIGLYHDLALANDRCGADLWAHRRFFLNGCRVGAPPDDFAPDGQDWSFPPPNGKAHREDGYRLLAETIRKNSRCGGALRIDHVMRFFRLFWIPDGLPAREGTYVNERWEDLLRILALESHRGKFLVIGEDLGTVPPLLREALERFGIFSYRLFYFERGEGGKPKPPQAYPRQALVSSTTHDLPTLAGYWASRDIEARRAAGQLPDDRVYERQKKERVTDKALLIEALREAGFLDDSVPGEAAHWTELTGEIHNAIIGFLVSTPSALMVLNQEDLTKETEQQNLPGTTWQYPNWRRKMRFTIEELWSEPQALDFALMFRRWLEKTGRTGSAA